MEPRQQLEAWRGQVESNPDAKYADLDVAKRLIVHGIDALDKIDTYKARISELESQVKTLRENWPFMYDDKAMGE